MLQFKTLNYIATTLLATLQLASATFDASSNDKVVLYWGQSSAGSQERLSYYCESDAADILVLSFLYEFPGSNGIPGLDFSSACSDTFSDGLLKCDTIASDILTCQSLGKKVLLSLGGASGAYGFSSDSEAETFATTLWNYFGGGTSEERPFGTATVDGFDFDIENNEETGYVALVNKLRNYFDSDSSKDYYISAAPQCPYPDASVGDLLAGAQVDFAFIQFYNNYCSLSGTFNWDTWSDFAKNTSPNKDIKLFLGLPASSSAAGSGYVDVDTVKNAVDNTIGSDSSFGGIMLWDASQLWANEVSGGQNYAEAMKSILTSQSTSAATTSTSSTAEPTTTSTSSTAEPATPTTTSTSSTVEPTTPTTTTTSSTVEPTTPATTTEPTTSSTSSSSSSTAVITPENPVGKEVSESFHSTSTDTTTDVPTTVSTTQTTLNVAPTTTAATTLSIVLTTAPGTTVGTETTTTSASSTTSTTVATSAATGFVDCSSLNGADKAKCLNSNFNSGLFLGSASSCNAGDFACTADGELAQCNFGEWVTFGCAAGTTCYAYSSGDYVSIGCNFSSDKSQYTKRQEAQLGHKHHFH